MTEREVVTMRDYIDTKIEALEKATTLAKETMERRLEGMNEFRDALKDQNTTFITRAEYENLCKEVQELRESRAELSGKADQKSVNTTFIIAILGVVTAFVGILLRLLGI